MGLTRRGLRVGDGQARRGWHREENHDYHGGITSEVFALLDVHKSDCEGWSDEPIRTEGFDMSKSNQ